ncbi:MAG: hypothetical protein ACK4ND_01005 [Cytophagaceae bacterium]
MKENFTKSNYSETWIENGVVVQNINEAIHEINREAAQQLIEDRKKASGGAVGPVLVIANNAVNITKDAKKFYEENEPYENISAVAMVMDNFITNIITNFVFKVKRNPIPIESFNDYEKAYRWLEKFK